MSEHTKEPWEAVTPCPGECCWHLRQATEDEYGHKEEITSAEMSGEDARRIVVCVNACAGISTERLEECVAGNGIYEMICKAGEFIEQRDELLAALLDLVNDPQDITNPAYQRALAAIAAVEGTET